MKSYHDFFGWGAELRRLLWVATRDLQRSAYQPAEVALEESARALEPFAELPYWDAFGYSRAAEVACAPRTDLTPASVFNLPESAYAAYVASLGGYLPAAEPETFAELSAAQRHVWQRAVMALALLRRGKYSIETKPLYPSNQKEAPHAAE